MHAVRVSRTSDADDGVSLPTYSSEEAAGMDLRANFPPNLRRAGLLLAAGQRALVPTGLRFEIPAGFEVQIRPRSGLALKHGIALVNSPGTIDSDYRGEIGVILINLGAEPFVIRHGDRIAQAVFAPVIRCRIIETKSLTPTERGSGGFGSTGSA